MIRRYTPHRGFAIVSAIFILVVLAALGAFILSVSTNQHIGSALDVQGVRAYQAARAGIEWSLYRKLRDNACSATPTSFVPTAPTLADLTITVSCVETADAFDGPATRVVTATACNQPGAAEPKCPNTATANAYYVERQLSVTF